MDFVPAVKSCLQHYAVFTGRAPRSEYWFFVLFTWVIEAAADIAGSDAFASAVSLALLLPSLAVSARRMHDINRSGWWLFIIAIPLIGWALWLIWACTPGARRYNRFGPDPLPDPAPQF
jgi:uncharacterized membrane protein YhaH (DUF805 family)